MECWIDPPALDQVQMAEQLIRASINQTSFLPGATVTLTLHFDVAEAGLDAVSNVSVDFHRIERERNQFAFGFGVAPIIKESTVEVSQTLPADFRIGLYVVNRAVLVWGNDPGARQEQFAFDPIVFAVQSAVEKPYSLQELDVRVNEINRQRGDYVHRVMKTVLAQNAVTATRFRVLIFGVGCLLHARQQLEGYSISPIGLGLSHRPMHDIVNTALQREGVGPIDFDPQAEAHFESTTPTFMVSYIAVEALNHQDALDHCRLHANEVFQILGLERGQMPREFAALVFQYGSPAYLRSFQMPGYRGNLVSDFNPVSTANAIERLLPKLAANPFLRLLSRTYADATAETNHGFALLRYWAVLELLADRYVTRGTRISRPDGSVISKANGKPELTDTKLGRVYTHILGNGVFVTQGSYIDNGKERRFIIGGDSTHPGYTANTELISLWDMVIAAYAIRNAIAHEGQFDVLTAALGGRNKQLAAKLVTSGYADPMGFLKQQAQIAFWRESNKP